MEAANPDLWQRLRGLARRAGFSAFWSWWIGQLAPLIPAWMHNVVRRWRLRLVLGADAVLWVPAVANRHLAYQKRPDAPSADAAVVAGGPSRSFAGGERAWSGPVRIVVAGAAGLRRRLPAGGDRDNLAQALTYDLDRHTPFKSDEVNFDAIIVGRSG
jgi:hypothetical protein